MPAKYKPEGKINRAECLVCEKKYGLPMEYQFFIRQKHQNYKSILQLAKDAHDDQTLTEDSEQFKNVKNFLVRITSGKEVHNFSEEQITFITENGEEMRPMEITRLLFPEIAGNPLNECRSVVAVLRALGISHKSGEDSVEHLGQYQPPASDHKVIALINRADPSAKYHVSQLDSERKKRIATIKNSLSSPRIIAMISAIRSKMHREVFETQFVLYLMDKDAPVAEDISTIANLANENVRSLLITEEIAMLNDRLAEATTDDENSRKFTASISDALSTKATEFNNCQNRMAKLHTDLVSSRADRFKHMGAIKESLAQFIELAKTEEGREYMLKLAKIREEHLHEEAKRIESLDDLVAEIRGVSIEELLKFR